MAFPKIGWHNILDPIALNGIYSTYTKTITSAAAGFPLTNIWDHRLHTQWKATTAAVQHLDIDAGVGEERCDYLAIAGHNCVTEGSTILVKADNFTPPTTVLATITRLICRRLHPHLH